MNKKVCQWIAVAICTSLMSACSESTADRLESEQRQGIWLAPAYDITLEIGEDDYTYYQYTENTCQRIDLFDVGLYDELVSNVTVEENAQVLINDFWGQKVPGVRLDRASSLPDSCITNLVANVDETGYLADPIRDFNIFWQNFQELYALFELKGVDWEAQRATYQPQVTASTTDAELFDIFAQMIEPLADGHVYVVAPDGETDVFFDRKPSIFELLEEEYAALPAEESGTYEDYEEEQFGLLMAGVGDALEEDADLTFNDTGAAAWSRLEGGIGYVAIFSMGGFTEEGQSGDVISTYEQFAADQAAIDSTFDTILGELGDTRAMIIDLRINEGGNDSSSLQIASRFTEQETLVWREQARLGDTRTPLVDVIAQPSMLERYRKPIVLITSATTASAAEGFILAMQAVTDVQSVGEATAGVFSDQLPKTLPNGTEFSISNEFLFAADGEYYEDRGIPVDVQSSVYDLADRQAGTDPALAAAMDLLGNAETQE